MAKQIVLDLASLPKTREEALRTGAKYYFTDKPCKYGHVAVRYRDGKCMECHRNGARMDYHINPEPTRQRAKERERRLRKEDPELTNEKGRKRQKAWRDANLERARVRERTWDLANRPRRRQQDRDRYARDPEKHRTKARTYRNAHPGYATEQNRDWRNRNPDAAKANHSNKRTRKVNAEGRHTAADIRRIRTEQNDRCASCHRKLNGKGHIDHIIPLARGGTNWPDNLQILCAPCNLTKWAHMPLNTEV